MHAVQEYNNKIEREGECPTLVLSDTAVVQGRSMIHVRGPSQFTLWVHAGATHGW